MKTSLDWLKDYVEIDCPVEELAEMLSNLGFPNEGIEYLDNDAVIDFEVTSNRGDCLSHIGIAREVAAYLGRPLRLPDVTVRESDKAASDVVKVEITNSKLCRRYTARVITGVKVGPSPEWIVKRLEAVGLRSVNNVVDATNYAMMEIGQPPHAFDFDKLSGGKIVVRNAAAGEKLVSIDGTKCELTNDMLVIADRKGPVAIAGVMGGLATEVSETTTTILLEDAQFDPVSIRTTGRRLGISSEASFRFERKVDTEMIDWASKRCAQLIVELAGGTLCKGVVDAYPARRHRDKVVMRMGRLRKLLGIDIDKNRVVEILSGLGFEPVVEGDAITCTSPTWRHDIAREVDLIEEVARSHGYDKIPVEKKLNIEVAPPDERERLSCRLRGYLGGCGYYETINVTFVDENAAGCFGNGGTGHLSIQDVSRKSANLLRRNLMGSLLEVLRSNRRAGNVDCRIYELADTFLPQDISSNALPIERVKLGVACEGEFRDLRGVIEGLIDVVRKGARVKFRPAKRHWAAAAAQVWVDDRQAGEAGVVSQDVAARFDLSEGTVCIAEIDLGMLLEMAGGVSALKPIPRFPAIRRDLSLVVDENVSWADIAAAVNTNAPSVLEELEFAGIYRGKPIPSGKKSVTASLRFRDEDGTLTHDVVDGFEKAILDGLTTGLGAELRTI